VSKLSSEDRAIINNAKSNAYNANTAVQALKAEVANLSSELARLRVESQHAIGQLQKQIEELESKLGG